MTDVDYMHVALDLALKGRGATSPNPMVGAVAVRNGEVIGSGFHPGPGQPHAEVFALEGLGDGLREVTLYTTLEPCSHTGRTRPCADLIIEKGVGRVVCAMEDPDPHVCGSGLRRLRSAGVTVENGVLLDAAERLNEAYVKHRTTGLPFVTLKLAMTVDGYIAAPTGDSRWVSSEASRARAHGLRAEADAVMVGSGTVRADNPELTVRLADGRDPDKIILDSRLWIADQADLKVWGGTKLCVACSADASQDREAKVESAGGAIWRFESPSGRPPIRSVLRQAAEAGYLHVLIEGGGAVAGAAVNEDVVDRLALFIAPKLLGGGVRAVEGLGIEKIQDCVPLEDVEVERIGDDLLYLARVGNRER